MSKSHNHGEGGQHRKPAHDQASEPASLQRRRVWMIAAIALMLLGMLGYVFTMDEEIQPEGPPVEEMPAEAPAM